MALKVNVPRRPHRPEAWGPYFPIWPRQSQDILIVLGKMWFSQWNLVFQTLAQIFPDSMLDVDYIQQTSVYIFQCEPMFAWAAIGSCKHRYTLKNVNRFLRFENIEKTTFYLIQWEYPNSGSVISEIWPSCFEMGVNVTPPACGRRGTLTPHFSAYRAIFSNMFSPESGYCSNWLWTLFA